MDQFSSYNATSAHSNVPYKKSRPISYKKRTLYSTTSSSHNDYTSTIVPRTQSNTIKSSQPPTFLKENCSKTPNQYTPSKKKQYYSISSRRNSGFFHKGSPIGVIHKRKQINSDRVYNVAKKRNKSLVMKSYNDNNYYPSKHCDYATPHKNHTKRRSNISTNCNDDNIDVHERSHSDSTVVNNIIKHCSSQLYERRKSRSFSHLSITEADLMGPYDAQRKQRQSVLGFFDFNNPSDLNDLHHKEEPIQNSDDVIQQHSQTIECLQKQNEQQQQALETLRQSQRSLLTQLKLQSELGIYGNLNGSINKNSLKNKKKKKKKQIKSKQKRSCPELNNQSSYTSSPYKTGQINVYIPKAVTKFVAIHMRRDASYWYKYMYKTVAMQLNDNPNFDNNEMIAIDFDFYDGNNQRIYGLCEIEQSKQFNCKYKMHEKLYTATALKKIDRNIEIPLSSRVILTPELSNKHSLQKHYFKIINIKWFDIQTFCRKDKMYNKQRIVLRLENEYMKKVIRDLSQVINSKQFIPIIMFNNVSHWIEWVVIVRIIENVDIGISFKYEECEIQNSLKARLKVSGIHIDKQLLQEQHYLISPKHVNVCTCFDEWKSYITDIDICGDLNENDNKIKDYKQKYESLKSIVHQFIDMNGDNYSSLKQTACDMVGYLNGSISESLPGSPFTHSPMSTTPNSLHPLYECNSNTLLTSPLSSISQISDGM